MHRFNLYTQNLIQRAIDVEQLKSHGKFGAANQSNAFQRNVISSKDCEQKDQSYVNVDIIFNVKRKIKKWMRIWINHSDSSHPHWILLASFENELREKKFSLKGIYDSYIWLDIFFWCIKYDIKKDFDGEKNEFNGQLPAAEFNYFRVVKKKKWRRMKETSNSWLVNDSLFI